MTGQGSQLYWLHKNIYRSPASRNVINIIRPMFGLVFVELTYHQHRKVIWRRPSLHASQTIWWSGESNQRPLCYELAPMYKTSMPFAHKTRHFQSITIGIREFPCVCRSHASFYTKLDHGALLRTLARRRRFYARIFVYFCLIHLSNQGNHCLL